MNTKRLAAILILIFIFFMGCSGTSGILKTQSESESKVTQQKLIDNWSDYNIRYRNAVLVFAPKNNDRKILLGGKQGWWWVTIEDQESWTEFVNVNMTSQGDFRPPVAAYPMTGVREIWGPDNQLYGFIVHQQMDIVNPELVEKDTMRVWINHARRGGR